MKKIVSFFLILITLISCSKGLDEVECKNKNTDEGIIVSSVDFGTCIYNLNNKQFVVQNEDGYKKLQEDINNGKITNDSCSFPIINFKENTLLGHYAEATGCTINFNRNVAVDSTKLTVDYIIAAEGCGDCDMLGYSYNFVLVNKIDDTYTILFNGK
jgi:hypothetical protein